jgi:hypothetical protein
MYLWTREGLEQVPTPYGSFAETLGEPPLPPEIQQFLDRVKKNPPDYEAVLLTATLHVEPWRSDVLTKMLGAAHSGAKSFDEAQVILEKILQTLEAIQKKHLTDRRFSELVKKEKALIPVVAGAFQKRIKEIESQDVKWFEKILTEAYLASDPRTVGRNFVLFALPPEIAERVTNSRVPETHYARLGQALFLIAEQRLKNNASFKEAVEKERKKQGG